MPPTDYERLVHLKEAIELIQEYVGAIDYEDFLRDRKTQLSVERLLEIIGEAANHIAPGLKSQYPDVPWRQIIDLRNVVSHQYYQLRLELIWEATTEDIPGLADQIERVLQDFGV